MEVASLVDAKLCIVRLVFFQMTRVAPWLVVPTGEEESVTVNDSTIQCKYNEEVMKVIRDRLKRIDVKSNKSGKSRELSKL